MIRRTGRRRGSPDTRETVLAAARRLFGEKGFDATTMRAIAAEAEVDPALVHHYFGNKEQLFITAMDFPIDPRDHIPQILAGPLDDVGIRLVRTFLSLWDSPAGTAGVALIRSAMSNDWMLKLFREFLITQLVRRVISELALDPDEAPLRASLVASQMAGLVMIRYIIKLEPLATLPAEQVAAIVAPNVQRYITGPLDDELRLG